jgi:hypothetical protein
MDLFEDFRPHILFESDSARFFSEKKRALDQLAVLREKFERFIFGHAVFDFLANFQFAVLQTGSVEQIFEEPPPAFT